MRPSRKQRILLCTLFLAVLISAVFYFTNRTPGYENGVHVRFEENQTAEQELSMLSQYDGAVILDADDEVPHDYTLVFPRRSDRNVKEIAASLCRTEGVLDASYVRVVSVSD